MEFGRHTSLRNWDEVIVVCEFESHRGHTMKKVIIEYNQYIIKVHLTEDNTSIIDSYRVKSISDMINVLKEIRKIYDESYAIHKRSIFSMVNEWRAHNLLYSLHIKRDRTGSVDLNIGQNICMKIAYTILSILYF